MLLFYHSEFTISNRMVIQEDKTELNSVMYKYSDIQI